MLPLLICSLTTAISSPSRHSEPEAGEDEEADEEEEELEHDDEAPLDLLLNPSHLAQVVLPWPVLWHTLHTCLYVHAVLWQPLKELKLPQMPSLTPPDLLPLLLPELEEEEQVLELQLELELELVWRDNDCTLMMMLLSIMISGVAMSAVEMRVHA